ncbi:MAG: four helix bundle protein, partial [Bacteroidetes bacterium]
MDMTYLKLNDWATYKTAFHLSNYVWNIVVGWDYFAQKTIGAQIVDAIDSIFANLAEGWGRYHKKDKVKFYRYAQGSCKESFDWTEKARIRQLFTQEQYDHIFKELEKIPL